MELDLRGEVKYSDGFQAMLDFWASMIQSLMGWENKRRDDHPATALCRRES